MPRAVDRLVKEIFVVGSNAGYVFANMSHSDNRQDYDPSECI